LAYDKSFPYLDIETSDTMGKEKGIQLKVPKGTRDVDGTDMVIREHIFNTISTVFKRHGGVTIDTPVFELKEVLTGKYGEDSKLIYDLADQGGELCSLRYDLTVPFARYLAMNSQIQSIKRYQIAKVYRRDQPAMTKGRMREFYQCDFDIAGSYDSMLPDAEILRIACEIFEDLGWKGKYSIKLNHRKILDGIFAVCGVPDEKIRTISSAVDKLDKLPWEEVKKEMTEEKGLAPEVADKIWSFVQKKGSRDVLEWMQKESELTANESMKQGMEDMDRLFTYLEAFDITDKIEFNLSLARGLDYYTGLISEIVTEGSAPQTVDGPPGERSGEKAKKKKSQNPDDDRSDDPSVGVGSIAAGGRYDNLVGMFSGKGQIPCVGISFGVERIFSVTKKRLEAEKNAAAVRRNEVDVYVMAVGGKGFTGLLKERMKTCTTLWDAGIKAEFAYKEKPKLPAQFKLAETGGVPWAIMLGEDEIAQNKIRIKEMGLPEGHPDKDGILVAIPDLVAEMKQRLSRSASSGIPFRQAAA